MKPKVPWTWIAIAGVLAVAILVHRYVNTSPEAKAPARVLPQLSAEAVTSVQVRPKGQLQIRAQKQGKSWRLTEPIEYPGSATAIDGLLSALQRLSPATIITAQERKSRPKADEEDGFSPPAATVTFQQGDYRGEIQFGARTAPGDQVFAQVVGVDSVYVVDAEILKYLPGSANDWRNSSVVDLGALTFNRLVLAAGPKVIDLQRDAKDSPWQMTAPMQARADSARVNELLAQLQRLQVDEFVSDDPRADAEALGFQPPQSQLSLLQGTNPVAVLQFGRNTTNNPDRVYARFLGQNTVMALARDWPASWQAAPVFDFRDPHLVSITQPVDGIEIVGPEEFSVRLDTNGTWRVLPRQFPADVDRVRETLATLNSLRIVEFTKDVVTPPALPTFGLADSARRYRIFTATTNAAGLATNLLLAELSFGTNDAEKVYARRSDETSVYAISLADFRKLPWTSLEFRERRLWPASEDIVGVSIRQGPRTRKLVRKGAHEWSLGAGSQGVIEPVALEETVRMLANVSAASWAGYGEEARARHGFTTNSLQVTVDFKNGEKRTLEFAQDAVTRQVYGCAPLNGEPWVFEFPLSLYPYVQTYLTIP